mmetsp:Transcript_19822/g.67057  ORF Transcript_19822/g.67057 Transcript_19822/m.67057 type:complete len:209 (+) Transcript_19822:2864-3490(+)
MASSAGAPATQWSSWKARAACLRTFETHSGPPTRKRSTAWARTPRWSRAAWRVAEDATSANPRHAPTFGPTPSVSNAATRSGTSSGMTRSPIFFTTSPSARDATCCFSRDASSSSASSPSSLSSSSSSSESSSEPSSARCFAARAFFCSRCFDVVNSLPSPAGVSMDTSLRTSVGRMSRSALGVLGTIIFQTSTAAWRTAEAESRRAM